MDCDPDGKEDAVGWGMKTVVSVASAMFWSVFVMAEPTIHRPRRDHLLLLDRRVIESVSGMEFVVGEPLRDPQNPLLPSDQPWENATNNYYPNVAWDQREGRWRLWYKDVLADADAIARMDGPSTVHNVGWYLLHAISRDGLKWERPSHGFHRFDGSSSNNIVARDCPNVGVFLDEVETDPTRRYKMVFDVGLGKPRVRFSADGVSWGEPIEAQGFKATQGDTHNNAFRDPWSGKFIWFTKMYLGERLVSRLESDDFVHWKAGGVVLRSSLEEGRGSQTYALTVFPYANGYLGYLMMYHVGSGRRVDCELAWSPDSVHWERVAPGRPILANGPSGAYDSGCIYAQAGPAVAENGRMILFYGGSPTVHTGWKRSGALCRATLPEDGFAGYQGGAEGGEILTTWLRPRGPVRVTGQGEIAWTAETHGEGWTRIRIRVARGATVYAIHGLELVNETMTARPEAAVRLEPVKRGAMKVAFSPVPEGWKGADVMEPLGDGVGVRVSRKVPLQPFAYGPVFSGSWPAEFGGEGVRLSARLRTPREGASARFEVFAKDVAQWWKETSEKTGTDFATFGVDLDFRWDDAGARAAGWTRSEQGFSWRETLRNAGKVVVMPSGAVSVDHFDLSEVMIAPISERAVR